MVQSDETAALVQPKIWATLRNRKNRKPSLALQIQYQKRECCTESQS